ncbi:hypothetical protein DFH11DRAFT_1734207 [Phellopilus nigrolimitatus]|nr:hypothetical protein DFH11DRAFT_1734207 [Phellopilus nigrolimitatus]
MSTDPRHALLSLLPPAGVERWPFAPEEMEGSLKARRNSGHARHATLTPLDAGDRALARGAVMMHVHKRKGSILAYCSLHYALAHSQFAVHFAGQN